VTVKEATRQGASVNEEAMGDHFDEEDEPGGPRVSLLPMAGVFYGLMFAAALIWGAVEGRPPVFAPGGREVDWVADPALGIGIGVLVVGISELITRFTRWGERTAAILGEMLGRIGVGDAVWLALASAIAEELLFRGAIQPHLGLVGTSVLFGVAHLAPRRELLPWTLMAVGAGFLLGGLFELTGNVLAPIAAHFTVNAFNLRQLSKRFGGGAERRGPDDD
jgi:membrane protease YdiL (CAAX protease family)